MIVMRNVLVSIALLAALLAGVCWLSPARGEDAEKPKVAVFPLGGSADEGLREKIGFSLRTKLDRDGTYEPIDGPSMKDLVSSRDAPVTFATKVDEITSLATDAGAVILIWGQMDEKTLRLHIFDTRSPATPPSDLTKSIDDPTDLRFAIEAVLETIPGVKKFTHPSESSLQDDAASAAAWKANPDLLQHGDFEGPAASEAWFALLRSEKYHPPISGELPDVDRVAIVTDPDDPKNHVLAMNMSGDVAGSNGLACISSAILIQPATRYRLQYRYKSDGPTLHVFVKGYATINGEERELYRRQVPPSGRTEGKWVTVRDDMNPQNGRVAVETLKVDLYIYLASGQVMFDDVMLKAVGKPTHIAKDDAIKPAPPP
jgi:hypothetical protein